MLPRAIAILAISMQAAAAAVAPWPTLQWAESTPEQHGMSSAQLAAGGEFVRAQCPNRYSFLVVRHGYLVWEQYFNGMSRDRYADAMSMSKSVLSLLIGQALGEGKIDSLDRRVADYFPEYASSFEDPAKRRITLEDLITMRGGLQWDEVASAPAWVASRDWYKHIVDLPMHAEPGTLFNYNTGLSHLLAGVLSRSTGESALAFATPRLFDPLGIRNFYWEQDPRGNYVGGFRMGFTSRDLAKFGYLALRQGVWGDRQLVRRAWIEESTAVHVPYASPTTIGDYAMHWWSRPQAGYYVFMAVGFGGQYVFVVPGLDLVMVSAANTAADTIDRHMQAFDLLTKFVIPSVRAVTEPRVTGSPRVSAVVSAADFSPGVVAGGWTTIVGANLSPSTRSWTDDDLIGGNLPVQLDGVAVTIGGKAAYVAYVSPEQINVVAPAGVSGDVTVTVTSAPGRTGARTAAARAVAPAIFAAQAAGDTIVLYASGLGPAAGVGEIARASIPPSGSVSVTIGGVPAAVEYAGIPPGAVAVYQINVRVPPGVAPAGQEVVLTYGGMTAKAVVAITRP